MFCPQCSTQNEAKQSYCRQCGQLLSTVHLALEGRADEAIKRFKQARNSLNYGLTFLGMFILIGLVTFLLGGVVPYAVLGIGFIVCFPSILKGLALLRRVGNLLDAPEGSGRLTIDRPAQFTIESPAIRTPDLVDFKSRVPNSVAEHTTRDLKTLELKD